VFNLPVKELKFQDSATIAAARWLADDRAPDPRPLVRPEKDELW